MGIVVNDDGDNYDEWFEFPDNSHDDVEFVDNFNDNRNYRKVRDHCQ